MYIIRTNLKELILRCVGKVVLRTAEHVVVQLSGKERKVLAQLVLVAVQLSTGHGVGIAEKDSSRRCISIRRDATS